MPGDCRQQSAGSRPEQRHPQHRITVTQSSSSSSSPKPCPSCGALLAMASPWLSEERRGSPDLGGSLLYASATPTCLGDPAVFPTSGPWHMLCPRPGEPFCRRLTKAYPSALSHKASSSEKPSLAPAGSLGAGGSFCVRGPHCSLYCVGLEWWVCRLFP